MKNIPTLPEEAHHYTGTDDGHDNSGWSEDLYELNGVWFLRKITTKSKPITQLSEKEQVRYAEQIESSQSGNVIVKDTTNFFRLTTREAYRWCVKVLMPEPFQKAALKGGVS